MIYLFLANGFEEIEAIAVYDILKRADINVQTVGISNDLNVEGAHGVTIVCDKLIGEIIKEECSGVILPGGMPGTANLEKSHEVKEFINYSVDNGLLTAAICAAPSVFGKMGILNGKNAVCYPGFEDCLKGAKVANEDVVICDNIITSKGPGTAVRFGLAIVSKLKGNAVANSLASAMQV